MGAQLGSGGGGSLWRIDHGPTHSGAPLPHAFTRIKASPPMVGPLQGRLTMTSLKLGLRWTPRSTSWASLVLGGIFMACISCSPTGSACASDADCGSEAVCGFLASAGCSSTGTCFPKAGVVCEAFELGCACDGSSLNLTCNGLPNGYATAPVAHPGACAIDSGIGE
jgi:hypothetical protein